MMYVQILILVESLKFVCSHQKKNQQILGGGPMNRISDVTNSLEGNPGSIDSTY